MTKLSVAALRLIRDLAVCRGSHEDHQRQAQMIIDTLNTSDTASPDNNFPSLAEIKQAIDLPAVRLGVLLRIRDTAFLIGRGVATEQYTERVRDEAGPNDTSPLARRNQFDDIYWMLTKLKLAIENIDHQPCANPDASPREKP